MNNNHWLERLETLAVRFNYLYLDADITSLSLIGAWALYLHLLRLVGA